MCYDNIIVFLTCVLCVKCCYFFIHHADAAIVIDFGFKFGMNQGSKNINCRISIYYLNYCLFLGLRGINCDGILIVITGKWVDKLVIINTCRLLYLLCAGLY